MTSLGRGERWSGGTRTRGDRHRDWDRFLRRFLVAEVSKIDPS